MPKICFNIWHFGMPFDYLSFDTDLSPNYLHMQAIMHENQSDSQNINIKQLQNHFVWHAIIQMVHH